MSLESVYFGDDSKYQDPYCYPGTDVLINDFGIRDKDVLNRYERALVSEILLMLHLSPLIGDFSLQHYLSIHKYLFDGIYSFSGKIRTVDIIKNETYFARHQFIESSLVEVLESMRKELPNVKTIDEYARKLATFYIDLNLIHPFREGNGRCEREFFREYVEFLNPRLPFGDLELDYSRMDKDTLLIGTIKNNDDIVMGEFIKALRKKTPQKII